MSSFFDAAGSGEEIVVIGTRNDGWLTVDASVIQEIFGEQAMIEWVQANQTNSQLAPGDGEQSPNTNNIKPKTVEEILTEFFEKHGDTPIVENHEWNRSNSDWDGLELELTEWAIKEAFYSTEGHEYTDVEYNQQNDTFIVYDNFIG